MKKTLLVILSAMVLGTSIGFVYAKPSTQSPTTASAIKLYKSGNYTQAYLALSNIILETPKSILFFLQTQ